MPCFVETFLSLKKKAEKEKRRAFWIDVNTLKLGTFEDAGPELGNSLWLTFLIHLFTAVNSAVISHSSRHLWTEGLSRFSLSCTTKAGYAWNWTSFPISFAFHEIRSWRCEKRVNKLVDCSTGAPARPNRQSPPRGQSRWFESIDELHHFLEVPGIIWSREWHVKRHVEISPISHYFPMVSVKLDLQWLTPCLKHGTAWGWSYLAQTARCRPCLLLVKRTGIRHDPRCN